MLERLNKEIRRRTYVVRLFPNAESCLRLVRALTSSATRRTTAISTWICWRSTRRRRYARRPDNAQAHQGDGPPLYAALARPLRFWVRRATAAPRGWLGRTPIIDFAELDAHNSAIETNAEFRTSRHPCRDDWPMPPMRIISRFFRGRQGAGRGQTQAQSGPNCDMVDRPSATCNRSPSTIVWTGTKAAIAAPSSSAWKRYVFAGQPEIAIGLRCDRASFCMVYNCRPDV